MRKNDDEEIHNENQQSKRHKAAIGEPQPQEHENQQENDIAEATQSNPNEVDLKHLERDPAKRKQMWEYPVNLREQSILQQHMLLIVLFVIYLMINQVCAMVMMRLLLKDLTIGKKLTMGKKCAFLKHIGYSQHRNAVTFAENLMNQATHIENIIVKQNEAQILKNHLRLKSSIDMVRWLTFQACALPGHDQTPNSKIENAPYNSKYTSGDIQKEILSIIANKVRKHIRSEVGDSYFCVMVDESRDESKKEQMAIVLRFVDAEGIIRERFLDLVHVRDTLSLTLKTNMWRQLLHYQFDVSKIHDEGYGGASNMRGEWNGLQALVIKDCPYAYKRHGELQKAKATEIEHLLELSEIESGIIDDVSPIYSQCGDADAAYCYLKPFEFVFILHLMKEVMGKTDILSQALQKKPQDILNAMELV
ncbi:uncharacterized protein LOC111913291 [Lactuca sativa]|uniref:uncharacterized protein LOC111913291 n=1 Tax=Lactuca sativa TaxID=4236 RepID=UPI000CD93ECC|nr:uncharacterized protein LOC111913291 [Lactuca sativa]